MSDELIDRLYTEYWRGVEDERSSHKLTECNTVPSVEGWYWFYGRIRGYARKFLQPIEVVSASGVNYVSHDCILFDAAYISGVFLGPILEPVNIDGIWYTLAQLPGTFHGPSKEAAQLSKEAA